MAIDINFGALQYANPFAAFAQGQEYRAKSDQRRATASAGQKLASGDYKGAAGDFYGVGMAEEGLSSQKLGVEAAQKRAAGLIRVGEGLKGVPMGQRKAALQAQTNVLQTLDIDPSPFMSLDESQLTDANIDAFSASLGKAVEEYTLNPGDKRIRNGRVVAENAPAQKPDWREIKRADGSTYFADFNAQGQPTPGAAAPPNPFAQTPPAQANTDDVFGALVMQESGGRRGVLGPQTQYGRAEGMTQMLPATAQGMAQKLGIAWRPELMRGTSDEAAQYQQKLGRAYFDEGLQKYGGDVEKALMYYHGGPDERLWGPKTRAYAQSVMRRTQPYQTASNAPVAPPSGQRTIEGSAAPQPEWVDLPGGGQRNTRTGKVEGGPRFDNFDREQKLRAQYGGLPQIKDMASVQAQVRTIGSIARKAAQGQPVTAQDDIALIFSFMKMLDPGSVVREGEFATAQNSAGIPDRIVNMYNRALKGTRLNNSQRAEIFNTASTAMDSYTTAAADQADRYRALAQSYGLNPDNITPVIRRPGARPQGGGNASGGDRPSLSTFQR